NDPVPGAQLHGFVARIGDDDGIGPEITGVLRRGTFRHEVRLDGDFDLAGDSAVHGGHDTQNWARNQSRSLRKRSAALTFQPRFEQSPGVSRTRRPPGGPQALTNLAGARPTGTI